MEREICSPGEGGEARLQNINKFRCNPDLEEGYKDANYI
jgi:hypothetical protein